MATSSLSLRFAPSHNPNNPNNAPNSTVPLTGHNPNPNGNPNNPLQLSPNSILLTDHLVQNHQQIHNNGSLQFDHLAHHHQSSHIHPHSSFLPHQQLMTAVVDTSHHSILSSIAATEDYAIGECAERSPGRKIIHCSGFHQGSSSNDEFDDKFPFSSDDVKPATSPPTTTNGHSAPNNTNSSTENSSTTATTTTTTTNNHKNSNSSKLKQEREILNNDIIVSEGQNDVTIEYMDLDEFLHENGLSNVCKGNEEPQQIPPLSHTQIHHNTSLEKHYPINLQHRGASSPSSHSSNNNNNNDDLLVATDLLLAQQQQERLSTASPSSPTTTTTACNNTLTCIIPPPCQNGNNLNVFSPDYQQISNRQCSPGAGGGSSNSLSSPSSSEHQTNLGSVVIGGRGRRRSSTKSIDSGRSLSPSTEGEGSGLLHKNGLEPRMIKRSKKEMVPDIKKDANYWKKREKNNLAAKRSRDSRREREAQISYKTKFLENENANLQQKLEKCLRQNEDLKKRLSKYEPI